MNSITVRRMKFDFPPDFPTVFIEGEPEESYLNIALSLCLPYVEPYLIKTMRQARPLVKDAQLAADLDKFCAQEGQHYKQHEAFNAVFRGRGFEAVVKLEQELEADYERFATTRPLKFNLAYAEGFEALTTVMSCVAAELDTSKWLPLPLDLMQWHMAEELEHRTVAFDVYNHVTPGYFYRLSVGGFAQRHLVKFMIRVRNLLMKLDTESFEKYGGKEGRKQRMKVLDDRFYKVILPRLTRTWTPWYTPRKVEMPKKMAELAERYTREAVGTS
jgi:predicted metal-dependent hydrolase